MKTFSVSLSKHFGNFSVFNETNLNGMNGLDKIIMQGRGTGGVS